MLTVEQTDVCQNCKDWGKTLNVGECSTPVRCYKCGRLTWPNLGVNLPAGAAWAWSASNAIQIALAMERSGLLKQPMPVYAYIRNGRGKGWNG